MRVFLDANVIFSASNPGSNIARLLQLLFERGTAVTSDYAWEEARRNVHLKRPDWSGALDLLRPSIELAASVQFPLPVELSDKDLPILCTAIRFDCQFLVTGDKRDFGHLYDQAVHGVTIISLRRLAELLTKQN